eukprot:gene7066-biopygen10953
MPARSSGCRRRRLLRLLAAAVLPSASRAGYEYHRFVSVRLRDWDSIDLPQLHRLGWLEQCNRAHWLDWCAQLRQLHRLDWLAQCPRSHASRRLCSVCGVPRAAKAAERPGRPGSGNGWTARPPPGGSRRSRGRAASGCRCAGGGVAPGVRASPLRVGPRRAVPCPDEGPPVVHRQRRRWGIAKVPRADVRAP